MNLRLAALFKPPFLYGMLFVFVAYMILLYAFGNFPTTLHLALLYAPLWTRFELAVSLFFSLAIAALIACNVVLAYRHYRERKRCHSAAVVTGAGTLGGFAAGLCPVCLSGLLPLVLGIFGVSFSLVALPFKGMELQVLVIVVLSLNLRHLVGMKEKAGL